MSLKNPALQGEKGFLIGAGVFAAAVAHKLEMTFEQLVEAGEVADGDVFSLTDSAIPTVVDLKIEINAETPMSTD